MALDKEVLAHAKKQDALNKESPDFKEYPKMLHGKDGATRLVNSEDEEKSLKGDWSENPKVTGDLPENDESYHPQQQVPPQEPEDIEALREQAKSLGIEVHHNHGVDKLKQLIDAERKKKEQ